MANQQFIAIYNQKIESFLRVFKATKDIYRDDLHHNTYFHNGEFGKMREEACIKLLRNTVCTNFMVSNGFVLNHDGGRTSQCDIIIYDPQHRAIYDADTGTQFFPAETVASLGEVKSCLNFSKLCEALEKLARNKAIRDPLNGVKLKDTIQRVVVQVDTISHHTVAPFTFLICDRIDGDIEKLPEKISGFYLDKSIPRYLHHNLILSLDDGVFTYSGDELSKIIGQTVQSFPYPKLMKEEKAPAPLIQRGDQISNIRNFLINLSNSLENSHCFYPEPTRYL